MDTFRGFTNTTTYANPSTSSGQANGLGDRLQQNANSATTTYTVDIAGGLTQVLSDGTNTYLYGVDRIYQQHDSLTEYYLADALGSVRQLTDSTGDVVLARAYDPYGNLVESNAYAGVTTAYGYTGEVTDSNGLVYLRARYYNISQARFISKDTWEGIPIQPISYNKWLYGYSNPIIYVDRSGFKATNIECDKIWFNDMRSLCVIANGDDSDPNVIDARYKFFWRISELSKLLTGYNTGFYWAGEMLEHYLTKGGLKRLYFLQIHHSLRIMESKGQLQKKCLQLLLRMSLMKFLHYYMNS